MAATIDSLKKAIGKKKKSRLFVWLADLEREAGNYDSALKILDEGLQEFPDMAHAYLVRSNVLMAQKNYDAALEACDAILKINPTCLSAIRRKGDIYAELGDEMARNKYYRLVHYIDPLDMFWKEEYSVVPEEVVEESLSEEPLILPDDASSDELLIPTEESEEDPFGMLDSLIPEETTEEESLSDALENSLQDVLENDSFNEQGQVEAPVSLEEDAMSGSDVSSAISDFFGAEDDDLFEESKPASPFSNIEIPVSLEDPEPAVQEESASPFEKSAETSVEESLEVPPTEETSVGLDSAFDALLGEDELPEESVSSFEKSAEISVEESLEAPQKEEVSTSVESDFAVPPPAIDLDEASSESLADLLGTTEVKDETGISSAFDSLFGEDDDLLEEELKPYKPVEKEIEEPATSSLDDLVDDEELTLPSAAEIKSEPILTKAEDSREIPSELSAEVSSSLDALFGDDDDDLELPVAKPAVAEPEENTGAFKTLFDSSEEQELELQDGQDKVDFLMSGDSEDEVSAALLKDPSASLIENGENIDERLNTPTLAEIYFEQGLYQKSLDIYLDLHEKDPDDEQIAKRLSEIQSAYDEKFGNRED